MDIVLDVRRLAPPEPMEAVLAALAGLQAGDRLRMLHRREPFPLYDLLPRMGYAWKTTEDTTAGEVGFEILIWHRDDGLPVPPT